MLTKRLSLAASYRYDNNEEFNNADSYRFGANYQINEYLQTFLSYAKAVKNPTFTERFGFFPGTFLGNSSLRPESSRSFEVGIDAIWQGYQIQLSWYQAQLENEILGFVFDNNSGLFSARNAAIDSQREGAELEVSSAHKQWRWSLNYAYLNATEGDAAELRRARHSGSAWLAYDISQAHQLYMQADYMGERKDRFFPPFPQASEVITLSNYWLVSANYRYRYSERLNVSLRVSNAFDQSFEDVVGFSGQSRRAMLNVVYSW
jgi:vitamin B12 transporter